jgi:hypothetical protein
MYLEFTNECSYFSTPNYIEVLSYKIVHENPKSNQKLKNFPFDNEKIQLVFHTSISIFNLAKKMGILILN